MTQPRNFYQNPVCWLECTLTHNSDKYWENQKVGLAIAIHARPSHFPFPFPIILRPTAAQVSTDPIRALRGVAPLNYPFRKIRLVVLTEWSTVIVTYTSSGGPDLPFHVNVFSFFFINIKFILRTLLTLPRHPAGTCSKCKWSERRESGGIFFSYGLWGRVRFITVKQNIWARAGAKRLNYCTFRIYNKRG